MTRIRLTAAIAFLACVAMAMAAGNQAGILDAARARDGAKVRALLAEGSDPKEVAADGSTALHWAAQWDDLETAAALLKAGADANAKNRYGSAPIMLAATNGSAPMLELLIQAGADPNTSIGEGETVLMTAAKTGRREAVEVLLLHGADVNAKEGWHGQTALMWAAGEGHDGAVEALTAAGAELASRSEGGFTAYLFAVRQGHSDVVQTLLDVGVDVNESLLVRRRRGRYPTGADDAASAERELGSSALDLAVANGHFELAALLLDRGADPNQAGPGWTPLHTISWVRNPGVGSNDPAPEGSGSMGSLELVRKLVQHGADVNFRMTRRSNAGRHSLNTVGATPFLAACRTADTELLQLLAELGADPLIPTEEGSTPLMVAAGLGTRAPDEDAGTPEEVVEAVKLVLALGGDPNVVNSNNDTAMHGAAYKHVAGVVPLLVAAGADINVWNIKNHLGWTPLRIATGVHRGMNLRASPETAAAIRKVMEEANVSTYVEPEGVISGETR